MKRRAFTLVELLVVIALIALLAVMLMPTFSNVIAHYHDTQCKNNLKRISDAFVLASHTMTVEGDLTVQAPGAKGLFPTGMIWPSVPSNVMEDDHILLFQCPEEEVKQASISGSLSSIEYESPHGRYPLDTIGEGNCYKSRRGRDPKGAYTEYMMQDDEGTGGQYANMSFNGWVDTDGGCRIYDSGIIDVWMNIETETKGSVPDWSGAHFGYPTGINTCGNMNNIRYLGEPSLEGNGKMQDARGKSYMLPNWGERMTNYGMNTSAYMYSSGASALVLVDYQESMADPGSPLATEGLLLQSARHFGRVNYLLSNGSVNTATPMEISPRFHLGLWRP